MDWCANAFLGGKNASRRFEVQLFDDEVAILHPLPEASVKHYKPFQNPYLILISR
jgi:hypothetical protein